MNPVALTRLLGFFSLALGAMEMFAPRSITEGLGLWGGRWLVRGFGLREAAAGLTILAKPDAAMGPAARVGGDLLDLTVLLPALSPANRQRNAAYVAFVLVAGITALDVYCTASLAIAEQGRARTAKRTRLVRPPAAATRQAVQRAAKLRRRRRARKGGAAPAI